MAKSVPRLENNREFMAIFENSYCEKSANKYQEFEDNMPRRMGKIPFNVCKSLVETYRNRLVSVELNKGYSTKY